MVRHSTDSDLVERDKKLLEVLERWGWFVVKVGAGESEPAFAYSIGLYEHFRHPEIIVFGLELETMHTVINDAGERIRQGQKYEPQQRYDDLLQNYECEFRAVNLAHYDGLLNYALWYYQGSGFPTLQLIWPDPDGRFPWEEGFDEEFRGDQPRLGWS
jgi:Domain of unknown function (DUF4262)